MYHSIHSEFIETPLMNLLEEGVNACCSLSNGVQLEPLKEYFLSSLFLRMTGAQEQKLKCLCWELATHDYEFRYEWLQGKSDKYKFGEMSRKEDKQKLYSVVKKKLLSTATSNNNKGASQSNTYSSHNSIKEISGRVKACLRKSPVLATWLQQEIDYCSDDVLFPASSQGSTNGNANACNYNDPNVLMGGALGNDHKEVVYRHRNRCAHNLLSYQINLPDLDELKDKDYLRCNYVYRFIILIVIDEVFIKLYKDYKKTIGGRLVF